MYVLKYCHYDIATGNCILFYLLVLIFNLKIPINIYEQYMYMCILIILLKMLREERLKRKVHRGPMILSQLRAQKSLSLRLSSLVGIWLSLMLGIVKILWA